MNQRKQPSDEHGLLAEVRNGQSRPHGCLKMCDPPLATVLATYACPRLKSMHLLICIVVYVMIPFKKKRVANPCDYAPIAKALAETCMDAATAESLM